MNLADLCVKEVSDLDLQRGLIEEYDTGFVKMFHKSMDIKRFIKSIKSYTLLENGNVNLIDQIHCMMVENISLDTKVLEASGVEKVDGLKAPSIKDRLYPMTGIHCVDTVSMILTFGDGSSGVSLALLSDVLTTFGVPTEVLGADDYPITLKYGDMSVLIAPRIGYEVDDETKYIKFDFKSWCPQLYGEKPNDITMTQLMALIMSMPIDSTIEDLIKQMASLHNATTKVKNSEDFF